jgi:hypothetical protein
MPSLKGEGMSSGLNGGRRTFHENQKRSLQMIGTTFFYKINFCLNLKL